jgi:hypothetical protein
MRLHLLGLVLFACAGESAADQACSLLANTRCMELQTCSATNLLRRFGDLKTCVEREQLACSQSLAAPETAATPTTIKACVAAVTGETCAQFFAIPPPDACLAQMGPRDVGAPCAFSSQCASAFCTVGANELCATCQPPPPAGASCATSGCGPNMNCVAATMQCQIPVAENGACDRTLPCAQGLTCVGAMTSTMGTCMMSVELMGGVCDPTHLNGADCDPAAGLSCDTTAHRCVTEPLAEPGQSCGTVGAAFTRCYKGASCITPAGHTAGTCVAPAGDGKPCDTQSGPLCTFPARCVPASSGVTNGTCRLPGSQSC